jgi:hypothetical protein
MITLITSYITTRISKTKVDFTVVKIKLVSRDGVLKDSTECAPTGHYFVPTYDKGSFFLEIEGPAGWNFGISSHTASSLHTSSATPPCLLFPSPSLSLSPPLPLFSFLLFPSLLFFSSSLPLSFPLAHSFATNPYDTI